MNTLDPIRLMMGSFFSSPERKVFLHIVRMVNKTLFHDCQARYPSGTGNIPVRLIIADLGYDSVVDRPKRASIMFTCNLKCFSLLSLYMFL